MHLMALRVMILALGERMSVTDLLVQHHVVTKKMLVSAFLLLQNCKLFFIENLGKFALHFDLKLKL